MSSRSIRKYLKENSMWEIGELDESVEADGEGVLTEQREQKQNQFAALRTNSLAVQPEDEPFYENELNAGGPSPGDDNKTEVNRNRRRRKRKNKKKAKAAAKARANKINAANDDMEFLSELAGDTSSAHTNDISEEKEGIDDIFKVNVNILNRQREMKKHIGEGDALLSKAKPQKAKAASLRKKFLVDDIKGYVNTSGEMKMVVVNDPEDRETEFSFKYDEKLAVDHMLIMQFQLANDFNSIVGMLQMNKSVPSALAIAYDTNADFGNMDEAVLLLERCLYAHETHIHPLFFQRLKMGKARMDLMAEENVYFGQSIFTQMLLSSSCGCSHTSFELAKLLLCLDKEDPFRVLPILGYDILSCQRYEFLDVLTTIEPPNGVHARINPRYMPNIAYTMFVAKYNIERRKKPLKAKGKLKFVLKTSKELLLEAVVMYPLVLQMIFEGCNFSSGLATELHKMASPIVTVCMKPSDGDVVVERLCDLYVRRNQSIYSQDELGRFIVDNLRLEDVEAAVKRRKNDIEGHSRVFNEQIDIILKEYGDIMINKWANIPFISRRSDQPKIELADLFSQADILGGWT